MPRQGHVTCNCSAYKFPHRFGGGKCDGSFIVDETWEENFGTALPCITCNQLNSSGQVHYCEVILGQESPTQCPAWQEFVQFNEVKVYK